MALHLFNRFHVQNESIPDFTKRDTWYHTKLLRNESYDDPTMAVEYFKQGEALRTAFKECNITSRRVTHTMRFVGAQWAKAAGCSEESIRQHGRWSANDRMVERYLSPVTLQPIRVLAGFKLNGDNIYYERDLLKPSEEFQRKIFPWVEASLEYVLKLPQTKESSDNGAVKYLLLLKYLRIVLIQDVVFLSRKYPNSLLFRHSIFSGHDFGSFAKDLLDEISKTPMPEEILIGQLAPDVEKAINGLRSDLNVDQARKSQQMTHITAEISKISRAQSNEVLLGNSRWQELKYQQDQQNANLRHLRTRNIVYSKYLANFESHFERVFENNYI